MKNLTYFPFERNHYYSGKLLSEQDFIKEQQYMNDKRRLQNRFLHGEGVVAGLRTLMVNEQSLSLEDGIALDFSGREIVVPSPAVYKLSMIDGFQKMEEEYRADDIYLCIEYKENENGNTPDMAPSWDQGHFDKTKESYRMYLTDRGPENYELGAEDYLKKHTDIFSQDDISITMSCYKAVVSGEEFEVSFKLTNKGNLAKININLKMELEGSLCGEKSSFVFNMENIVLERGQSHEECVRLRCKKLEYGTVNFTIEENGLEVSKNQQMSLNTVSQKIEIPVVQENMVDFLKKEYLDHKMENIVSNNRPRGIYLAKIFLIRQNTSYVIDHVEAMPFNQYIYSSFLMSGIVKELEHSIFELKRELKQNQTDISSESQNSDDKDVQYGSVDIPINYAAKAGQTFFSKSLYHTLGVGISDIELSIREDDYIYSGAGDVFPNKKIKANLAVKQDIGKGNFVIGLKLLENTDQLKATVHYTIRKTKQKAESQIGNIRIVPSKLELRQRESYSLEAICDNVYGATVLWTVLGNNAGTISMDGTYTAPSHEGVFEILATCEQRPDLKASLYVVVRE